MKIIVTHTSPDMDAITSSWIVKRFVPGWENAKIEYVPAGSKKNDQTPQEKNDFKDAIEKIGEDEVIHVDTGMGPLDHHQTSNKEVSAASRALEYAKLMNKDLKDEKLEAVERMTGVVVDIDHFKEVYRKDPMEDYHDFGLMGILDGLKLQKPDNDSFYTEFVMEALDALLHEFENRVWAEKEIKEQASLFETPFGRGLGIESINDSVLRLAQKMGYSVVVRKDPRKGYVRIKANPASETDLTSAYEKLKEIDPTATWYLHVSKKMLLNGTAKNPKMRPSQLSLSDIIDVLKT